MNRRLKDSYIDWVGSIPYEWETVPLKYVISEINEKNNPIRFNNILSLTNTLGVVPYEEKGNQGNNSKEDITQYKLAYKDTIIVNSMNLKIGSVGLSKYDGCVSPVYYVFKGKSNTDIRFINYLFQSEFQKYLGKFGKGILEIREKIAMYDVLHAYIPYPSYDIQKRIANYLDEKCSLIDNIIVENNKEIELLNEYRVSFIDSQYKSNNTKKIKFDVVVRNEKGTVTSNDKYVGLENIEGFTTKYIETNTNYLGSEGKRFYKGDLLVNKLRPYLAKSYIAEFDGLCSGEIEVIKNFNGNMEYLKYFTVSNSYLEMVNSSTYGAKMPRANWEFIKNLRIPNISPEEQNNKVEIINNMIDKINNVINYRKKIIEKLEEYKKSLIYEVVTGKKEV